MKMNRHICMLSLLLAFSCSGTDPLPAPEPDIPILLRVSDSPLTRAEGALSYDTELLAEEASWPGSQNYFRVTARFTQDLTKTYIDSYVMYNTYDPSNPWRFCTTGSERKFYYWPGASSFDFFAYAPAMSGGAAQEPTIAANGVTYDGFDTAANVHSLSCDLSAFRDLYDQTDLKEFIYAYAPSQTQEAQGESGVTLQFQHPLSAIFLRIASSFQNTELYTVSFTARADDVNGRGIYYEGSGVCSTDGTQWTPTEGATASPLTFRIYKTMGYDLFIGDIYTRPFLVMPQALTDREGLKDVIMNIRFRKEGSVQTKEVNLDITDNIKVWESGKAYIYSLDLGKDESIIVGANVEPWDGKGNYTDSGIDKDD